MARPWTLPGPGLPLPAVLPGLDLARRWQETLADCLPGSIKRRIALRNPRIIIVPRGDDAEILRQLGDGRESIGTLDLRTGASGLVLPASSNPAGREAWIELPSRDVLVRDLILPVQVKGNLRQVVSYEIDRLTPFALSDIYFDARVAGTLARGSKLAVTLAVCRRDRVAAWIERLRDARVPATRLTWEGAWTDANLLPVDLVGDDLA